MLTVGVVRRAPFWRPDLDRLGAAPPRRRRRRCTLPKQSPRASVSQTVGLTTIGITYDRPAVNGRRVWGKLVPFDSVWRAGANENTVLELQLAGADRRPDARGGALRAPHDSHAGRLDDHLQPARRMPGAASATIRRRTRSASTATPAPGDMHERLAYTFDDPTDSAVVATLRWEKLTVPFTDRGGHQGRRDGQSARAAPGPGPLLLAAVEPGGRLVRRQRRQSRGGHRLGRPVDRHERELHQPAGEGGPARPAGRRGGRRGRGPALARRRHRGRHEHLRLPADGAGEGRLGDRRSSGRT